MRDTNDQQGGGVLPEETILSALLGLVGACDSNPKTAHTDRLVIEALTFPQRCPEADDAAVEAVVALLHAEKYTVAPGCAQCAAPCGNTSDYDMRRLYAAAPEIRALKLELLEALCAAARLIRPEREDCTFFYRALSYLRYDVGEDALRPLLTEAQIFLHSLEPREDAEKIQREDAYAEENHSD